MSLTTWLALFMLAMAMVSFRFGLTMIGIILGVSSLWLFFSQLILR